MAVWLIAMADDATRNTQQREASPWDATRNTFHSLRSTLHAPRPSPLALAIIGFTATIAQVVLMRELVATLYGNELIFGLVLGAWLAWGAAGAWGLGRLVITRRLGPGSLAMGMVLAGLLLPLQVTLVRFMRALLGATPGAFIEFGPMVGAVLAVLSPLCLLLGCLFTLGARLLADEAAHSSAAGGGGRAYTWEGAGSVTGGVLFSFVLVRWFDPYQVAGLVLVVNLVGAAWLWLPARWRSWPKNCWPVILGLVLLLGLLPLGKELNRASLVRQWPDLAFTADSPYGRLVIQARAGQRIFFVNGLLAFETQGTFPEEVAHFPLLAHPEPREVLLIGGGAAGDVREILQHPGVRVTYVELDPLLIEAARTYLPPADAAVLADPRVTLVFSDGRQYVKTAARERRFDVVILDLPEPATGSLNRFYTREFFGEVQAVLQSGGLLALGLPSAENYWNAALAQRNGSVYATLRAVFPEVVVLPGEHNFFLASAAPVITDPLILAGRLAGRGITPRWVTPDYIHYVFTTDRYTTVQRQLAAADDGRLNQDLNPICYFYDLAWWLSRFYPELSQVTTSAGLLNLSGVAALLAGIAAWFRWRRGSRWTLPVIVAGVGMSQMMLEVILLFAFQVRHGYVYAEVSLLITAFMGGLALGSMAGNRLCLNSTGGEARKALLAILGAIVIYSSLLPLLFRLPLPASLFLLLAGAAGLLTGMAFPLGLAMSLAGEDTGRGVGRLYAADLAGGCLGALSGAVIFIPVLGIPQTCLVISLVGLAGLVVLL